MDLNIKKGDKVIFLYPKTGTPRDVKHSALFLVLGHSYTVERVKDGDYPLIYLQEVIGESFISSHFENYNSFKIYLDGMNLPVFVSTGISDSTYSAFRRKSSGSLQRIKPIPSSQVKEKVESALQSYAQKKGWQVLNP